MGRKKIRKPKSNAKKRGMGNAPVPQSRALSADPETLISNYRNYQGEVANINEGIRRAADIIAAQNQRTDQLKNAGMQVVGKIDLTRQLLEGFGVDLKELDVALDEERTNGSAPAQKSLPALTPVPDLEEEEYDEEAVAPDVEGDIYDEDDWDGPEDPEDEENVSLEEEKAISKLARIHRRLQNRK